MEDPELDEPLEHPEKHKPPFAQMFSIFIKPKQTLTWLSEQNRNVWLWPLLALSLAVLLGSLMMMSARGQASMSEPSFGPNEQWMTEDQKMQIQQAASTKTGALFTLVLPAVGGILGVWGGWVILGSVLNLAMTLMGSRGVGNYYNLAAFAILPLALRQLVMGLGTLISGRMITSPGLAGFVPADGSVILRSLLSNFDIYWFWQLGLLLVGAAIFSRLPRTKAWLVTLFSVLLFLMFKVVPAYLTSKLSGLNTGGGGMFFF